MSVTKDIFNILKQQFQQGKIIEISVDEIITKFGVSKPTAQTIYLMFKSFLDEQAIEYQELGGRLTITDSEYLLRLDKEIKATLLFKKIIKIMNDKTLSDENREIQLVGLLKNLINILDLNYDLVPKQKPENQSKQEANN